MGNKKVYASSQGPFIYDDLVDLDDPDGDFAPLGVSITRHALITDGQLYVEEDPTEDHHVLRLKDKTSLVKDDSSLVVNTLDMQFTVDNVLVMSLFATGLTLYAGRALSLVNAVNEFSTDGTLADNSDNALPTEKAVKTYVDARVSDPTLIVNADTSIVTLAASIAITVATVGVANIYTTGITFQAGKAINLVNPVTEFSTDGTLAGDSDSALPTEKAVKAYVDGAVSDPTLILTGTTTVTTGASDVGITISGTGVANFYSTGLTFQSGKAISLVNAVNEFSTDTALAGNSDSALPTEKAVKTYVDGKVSSYALDSAVVHNTGTENIAGVKTFTSIPKTPLAAPTLNSQVANKGYVDSKVTGASGSFTTADSKTVTVVNGLITSIV